MTPIFETLELQIDQHVATVSLNRPDRANAMNAPLWAELQTCFEWLDEEPSVRAIILAGNGKNFCAGLDLAMFGSITGSHSEPSRKAEALRRTLMRLQGNLSAIENCRKPVLAAIHKACVDGGIDMTCCADAPFEANRSVKVPIRQPYIAREPPPSPAGPRAAVRWRRAR